MVILDESDEEEPKKEPTPYAQLDVKKLKVPELRTELQARDLPTDGRCLGLKTSGDKNYKISRFVVLRESSIWVL